MTRDIETSRGIPEELGLIDEVVAILSGSHDFGVDRHTRLIGLIGTKTDLSEQSFSRDYLRRIEASRSDDRVSILRWVGGLKRNKDFKAYASDPYFFIGETSSLANVSIPELQSLLRKISLFLFLKELKKYIAQKGLVFEINTSVSGAISGIIDNL